ncbi:hypothetical protein BD779DRAFT_1674084 [Infundibulicybe gibba]|nr:hypothetical protein BD779DRAFT_1674084 [Infundibulicybe gibba]
MHMDSKAADTSGPAPLPTIEDVQERVATEIAIRAVTKAESVDGVKVGVVFTLSTHSELDFLQQIAECIQHRLVLKQYLFIVSTGEPAPPGSLTPLVICGSSDDYIQKAILLAGSKFIGRIDDISGRDKMCTVILRDAETSLYDTVALSDLILKSARRTMDPLIPPPGSKGIDEILAESRAKLQRLTPQQAHNELHEPQLAGPAFLVDIRPAAQREAHGAIQGALVIERNVLEWRLDPRHSARLPIADRFDLRVIVFCQEGYTSRYCEFVIHALNTSRYNSFSSLAAYSLQQVGLLNATDIIGGYQAWKDAGLPLSVPLKPPSSHPQLPAQ